MASDDDALGDAAAAASWPLDTRRALEVALDLGPWRGNLECLSIVPA